MHIKELLILFLYIFSLECFSIVDDDEPGKVISLFAEEKKSEGNEELENKNIFFNDFEITQLKNALREAINSRLGFLGEERREEIFDRKWYEYVVMEDVPGELRDDLIQKKGKLFPQKEKISVQKKLFDKSGTAYEIVNIRGKLYFHILSPTKAKQSALSNIAHVLHENFNCPILIGTEKRDVLANYITGDMFSGYEHFIYLAPNYSVSNQRNPELLYLIYSLIVAHKKNAKNGLIVTGKAMATGEKGLPRVSSGFEEVREYAFEKLFYDYFNFMNSLRASYENDLSNFNSESSRYQLTSPWAWKIIDLQTALSFAESLAELSNHFLRNIDDVRLSRIQKGEDIILIVAESKDYKISIPFEINEEVRSILKNDSGLRDLFVARVEEISKLANDIIGFYVESISLFEYAHDYFKKSKLKEDLVEDKDLEKFEELVKFIEEKMGLKRFVQMQDGIVKGDLSLFKISSITDLFGTLSLEEFRSELQKLSIAQERKSKVCLLESF